MKKIMLMFIFVGFNVGAMELKIEKLKKKRQTPYKEENQIYAEEFAKEFKNKFKEKLPKTISLETIFKDFLTAYPEPVRTNSFIDLAHLVFNEKLNLNSIEEKSKNEKILWLLDNLRSTNQTLTCLQTFLNTIIKVPNKENAQSILQKDVFDSLVGENNLATRNTLQVISNLNLKSYRILMNTTIEGTCHIKSTEEMTDIEKTDYGFLQGRIKIFKDTLEMSILENFQFSKNLSVENTQKNIIKKILLAQNIEKIDLIAIQTCLSGLFKVDFYTNNTIEKEEPIYYYYPILKDLLQEIIVMIPWNDLAQIYMTFVLPQDNIVDIDNNKIKIGTITTLHILNKYDQTMKKNNSDETKETREGVIHIIENIKSKALRVSEEKIYTESKRNFEFMRDQNDPITQLLNQWQPIKPEIIKKTFLNKYLWNKKTGMFLGISALAIILLYFRKKIQHMIFPSPANPASLPTSQKSIDLNDIPPFLNHNS